MFNQLIIIVVNLNKGMTFSITEDWLNVNGINATASDAKVLGRQFAQAFSFYGCRYIGKMNNNLRVYEKI